ncbi:ornithine-acyl-ACP acyltransferase, partial [Staphylococcus capitis]|nr:ornithine-acyl-ACP acyltransferase [Staphylococcus capitis]
GRVTVAPEHRNGAVMGILWAGIFRYQQMTEHQYAIGCLSVHMEDGGPRGSLVRSVHDFAQRFAAPEEYRVIPRQPVVVDGVPLEDIPPQEKAKIPPLLHGCLRIGGRICGPPSFDPEFDMADFLVLVTKDTARQRYLERLERSLALG